MWNLHSRWCHYIRRILESMEVFVRGRVERNAFHRVMNGTADGTKIQEYRNKLTQIMQHFEVISPHIYSFLVFLIIYFLQLELHLQSHEVLQSIKAIVVRYGADSTEDAALIQRNGDDLDHRPDAFEDGNGRNCQKCASSKSPKKKAESSTRRSNHERAVPLSSSRKPKVESESEIDVGETTEEERTRRAAKRAGKEKANQARTENVEDIPHSWQPNTSSNNLSALHALPMPIFSPYYPPPYHPWLYYQSQAMQWMIPPPFSLAASMPSINTYWTSNINSNNFTKTAMNDVGNDHSKHRTNWGLAMHSVDYSPLQSSFYSWWWESGALIDTLCVVSFMHVVAFCNFLSLSY